MFSLIYYLIKDQYTSDKRYSLTLLIGYLIYEITRMIVPKRFKDTLLLLLPIDLVILGSILSKEKGIKLIDYLSLS